MCVEGEGGERACMHACACKHACVLLSVNECLLLVFTMHFHYRK